MALATNMDLFKMWGVVLGSIMLSRTAACRKNTATMTVVEAMGLHAGFSSRR